MKHARGDAVILKNMRVMTEAYLSESGALLFLFMVAIVASMHHGSDGTCTFIASQDPTHVESRSLWFM